MSFGNYLEFLLALVFVIGLIGVLALGAKRLGLGLPQVNLKGGKSRRLSIIEVASIDARRRLLIVRCGEDEHLLLVGPNSETVVKTDINRKVIE